MRDPVGVGLSRKIISLALENGGYLSREQMQVAGLSRSTIDRLVNTKDIVPMTAGVYQVIPSDDHRDLLFGAILALPDGVVSHESAAHLLRFPELPQLVPTVTVPSHTTHEFPGVRVRRADDIAQEHKITVDGLPTTNAARTLFDLAGILRYEPFLAIAEPALLSGRVKPGDLRRISAELSRRGKRGSRSIQNFLGEHSGRPSTPLEVKGRAILKRAQLPTPTPEFPIPWALGKRFDDAYPEHRFALEWDSRRWHLGKKASQRDRERDREAVVHGWVVARFTWEDVTERPQAVAGQVARILEDRTPSRT